MRFLGTDGDVQVGPGNTAQKGVSASKCATVTIVSKVVVVKPTNQHRGTTRFLAIMYTENFQNQW